MPTNRDGVRYGTERDLYAMRCGPGRCACLRIGTACVLTDRDDERHGAGPDGERTVGTAFDMRCGYDRRVRTVRVGTTCERDGAGAAGVAGRVHGCCASSRRDRRRRGPLRLTTCETGGLDRGATCERTDEGLNKVRPARRRSTSCSSTSPKAVAYSWRTRQLLGHPRGLVGVSEVRFHDGRRRRRLLRELSWFLLRLMVSVYVAWWSTN